MAVTISVADGRRRQVISEVLQANPPHTTRMTIAHLGTVFCLDPLMTGFHDALQ